MEADDQKSQNNQDNITELSLACWFCGEPICSKKNDLGKRPRIIYNKKQNSSMYGVGDENTCKNCGRKFPMCSVCERPIEINNKVQTSRMGTVKSSKELKCLEEDVKGADQLFVWCSKCDHGGHVDHYKDWFEDCRECPAENCECNCKEE